MREEEERSRREQQAKEEEEEGTHEEEDEGKQDEGEEEEEGEREKQQRMNKGKASSPSLSPSFVVRRLSASSWSWEVCRGRGMFLGAGLASSTVFPRGHFVVLSRLLAAPGRGDGLHPEADNADVGVLRPQGSEVDPWDPSRGACGAEFRGESSRGHENALGGPSEFPGGLRKIPPGAVLRASLAC